MKIKEKQKIKKQKQKNRKNNNFNSSVSMKKEYLFKVMPKLKHIMIFALEWYSVSNFSILHLYILFLYIMLLTIINFANEKLKRHNSKCFQNFERVFQNR